MTEPTEDGFPPISFKHYPIGGSEVILRQMVGFGMDDLKILIEAGDDGPEVTASVGDGPDWQVELAVTLSFIAAAAIQPSHPEIAEKLLDVLADLNDALPDTEEEEVTQ